MSFNIEVLKVNVTSQGKFRKAVVDHKTSDGKVDSKQLVSFGAGKAAFDVLSQAQQGDVFEIESKKVKNEKDGKEYWTWISATSVGKAGATTIKPNVATTVRSSYETPSERAARQVYIVRQSSIANAIAYFALSGKVSLPGQDPVFELAKKIEAYVFANGASIETPVLPSEVD